jgi:2-methylcitrate dehydratase PrpD
MTSVTQTLAEWIAGASYDDVPEVALRRVEERFVDTLGVQLAGMATPTGRTLLRYLRGFGTPNPESSVVGAGYKTTTAFATLMNGTAGHALEFDDISAFSGHYANPLTAATLAVGEKLGVSGRDLIVAWMVGYEVVWRTAKPTADQGGSKLLQTGWFNQGFQPVMGVAAATAKLLGLDVDQIRMAIGHAASAMGGVQKNRGSDTKGFTAGSAAMHGVMAAELVSLGFTGNPDILDGDDGVIRMIGQEVGDPQKVIDDLGTWDMAERGSTMRLNASCAAGHWGMAAIGTILDEHPLKAEEIESIEVRLPAFLEQSKPYHHPGAGLESKYSVEYDMVAMVLDGRGGLHQYTDEAVRRPEAQALMERVRWDAVEGPLSQLKLESTVTVTLKDGARFTATSAQQDLHGTVFDPLTEDEIRTKFHECAAVVMPDEDRQNTVIDLCLRLRSLPDVSELATAIGVSKDS